MNMTPDDLKIARKSYGYIPARLIRVSDDHAAKVTWKSLKLDIDVPHNWATGDPKIRTRYSSQELDTYHDQLLNSERDDDLLLGLLSVVFCGYASGVDGRVNPMFALSRSRRILCGRKNVSPQKVEEVIAHLRRARELLKTSRSGKQCVHWFDVMSFHESGTARAVGCLKIKRTCLAFEKPIRLDGGYLFLVDYSTIALTGAM